MTSSSGDNPTRILSAAARDKTPPQMIGPYRVIRRLGEGGMGEVLLAEDAKLGRHVAIKLIRRELVTAPQFLERFEREAKLCARLNHPRVVSLYQVGEVDGNPYQVLEYVKGMTLRELLRTPPPLPLAKVCEFFAQAAEGLEAARAAGIIHRDIKPGNIMVRDDGLVKVMDFGLSKGQDMDGLTQTQAALGTPEYMAPEQAEGKPLDHRADIYALGISLFQCVTGYLPFRASSAVSTMMKQVHEPLPADPKLQAIAGGRLDGLIRRMTAKDPADRPWRYIDVIEELRLLAALLAEDGQLSAAEVDLVPSPRGNGRTPKPAYDPQRASGTPPVGYLAPAPAKRRSSSSVQIGRQRRRLQTLTYAGVGLLLLGALVGGGLWATGGFPGKSAAAPDSKAQPVPGGDAAKPAVTPTPAPTPDDGRMRITLRSSGRTATLADLLGGLQAHGVNFVVRDQIDPRAYPASFVFEQTPPDDIVRAVTTGAGWSTEDQGGILFLARGAAPPQQSVRAARAGQDTTGLPNVSLRAMSNPVTLLEACEGFRYEAGVDYLILGEGLTRWPITNVGLTNANLGTVMTLLLQNGAPMEWAMVGNTLVIVPKGTRN
ncbi:MAG: serine/threonine-protein kinase [Sumerlaeia bacterium]